MAKCSKCKKELKFYSQFQYKGKIYCNKCHKKVLAKDKINKKKQKHIKDAKKAVKYEYDYNKRKLVLDRINSWKPKSCRSETSYKNSLKKHLDKELSADEIYVGNEHGLGISRLDLVVGKNKPYRDIAIEIKYKLKDSSDFDRLKGQIHTYIIEKFKHLIIVLTGKTALKLETELKKYIKEMIRFYKSPLGFNSIDIIKK